MREIDCRGLNCPEPVLKTKEALMKNPGATLEVIVDNETARENVLRFARKQGRTVQWKQKEDFYQIYISGSDQTDKITANEVIISDKIADRGAVLLVSTDQLGQGSSELGNLLMRNFLYTLTKREDHPQALVFMNTGVKLCIDDSPVIDELAELQSKGVQILVCGTCLDYYQLKEQHRAGEVSNMYDISDLLFSGRQVITI